MLGIIIVLAAIVGVFIFWLKYSSEEDKKFALGVVVFFIVLFIMFLLGVVIPTGIVDMFFRHKSK